MNNKGDDKLNNKKKSSFWVFFIAFMVGSILKNIIEGFIGFEHKAFTNGFNILNFSEDLLIFMICYMVVYLLVISIKSRWKK